MEWNEGGPTWREWARLPFYGLSRLPMSFHLLRPLLRHPLAALSQACRYRRSGTDGLAQCLGVPTRVAFLDIVKDQLARFREGRTHQRPRVWVFQAYCEKPLGCACQPSSESPYGMPGAQRRFNEFCRLASTPPGRCGADCRIGDVARMLAGRGGDIQIELKVMLNEPQMADFWEEMLVHRVRTGDVLPFIMDVCPLALWLARVSLFRFKCPVGVVFPFDRGERCRGFEEYIASDRGRKAASEPVGLSGEVWEEKLSLLRDLIEMGESEG